MADVRSAVSGDTWAMDDFLAHVAKSGSRAQPYDEASIAFCSALSRALLSGASARTWPQLASLGYWLRPASVARMRQAFEVLTSPGVHLVPRGLVFHVAPGNVDTMFVYSWVPSLLTGNVSVVRVSERSGDASVALLQTIGDLLMREEFAGVRARSHLVHTAHDDAVARALSAASDVRVVWGGDSTVAHFRQFPVPPRGRDVGFPDRHSMAIIDADAICRADEAELASIGDSLFNDAYWFDQGSCSAPRLIVWIPSGDLAEARSRLREALDRALRRRGYRAAVGTAIEKVVRGYRAASEQDGVRMLTPSNEVTWVELPDLSHYSRDTTGGGMFFEVAPHDLTDALADFVDTKDQTAACYGLDDDMVADLVRTLNGRGLDRFVKLGHALEFDVVWDGYDLQEEFVKRVVVDV